MEQQNNFHSLLQRDEGCKMVIIRIMLKAKRKIKRMSAAFQEFCPLSKAVLHTRKNG